MIKKRRKPIKLFIAYSAKDKALYREFEVLLNQLKASGKIHSWYERKIAGEKWDQLISDKLTTSNIIIMLVSVDFLTTDYCYQDEVRKAVELHKEGKIDLIPIILQETDLEDTPLQEFNVLPSNRKSVRSRHWKSRDEAYKNITEGLNKVIEKINQSTKDTLAFPGKQSMSSCIKGFNIQNFKCLKKTSISEIPADARWVFLTGENGDGKTSLLQALAIGLLENSDKYAWHLLTDPEINITIEFKQKSRNKIYKYYKNETSWKRDTCVGLDAVTPITLLGYGVTRMNIQSKQVQDSDELKESTPAYSLFNETEGNFQNIEVWLKDKYLKSDIIDIEQIEEVKATLKSLMPIVKDIRIKGADVIYQEEDGHEAQFNDLSSGYKSIVAMIGDMLIKILKLQPGLKNVSEFEGIVFIDELDLHMHPLWQIELPELLTKAFPNVQFWAATHSIVPFMGAPEKSVFLKVIRSEKEGTTIEKLNLDVKNLLPNTLISSPLFDLENFIHKQADDFRTEYLYSEVLKNRELGKKLEEAARKFKLPKSFFDPNDTGEL
jgi:predicted ATPase